MPTARRPQAQNPDDILGHTDPHAAPTADAEVRPSKSQRKRDAHALQALGVQLVELSPARLARIVLPEALCEAVVAARGMHQHGARLRQMQYIGKLMRQLDPVALRTVREALDPAPTLTPRAQP
jgi:ribosome-associated protein